MKASGVQITLDSTDFDCMDRNIFFPQKYLLCVFQKKKEKHRGLERHQGE